MANITDDIERAEDLNDEKGTSRQRNDLPKLLACCFMLVDHIGYMFFPQTILFRIIGRLAFPIFAFQVAKGYTRTHNLARYMGRLAVFSLVSQVPYLWFSPGHLNIMPTLLAGLCVIWLGERGGRYGFLMAGLAVVSGDILHLQYGSYGLMMIWGFHLFRDNKGRMTLFYAAMSVFFAWAQGWSYSYVIQFFSAGALPFIFADWKIKVSLNRYFFYIFYPGHIAILLALEAIL